MVVPHTLASPHPMQDFWDDDNFVQKKMAPIQLNAQSRYKSTLTREANLRLAHNRYKGLRPGGDHESQSLTLAREFLLAKL